MWPLPGAIRFDACSAANRPGRHGLWQRPLERRRLAAAPLLLPWSEAALRECPAAGARTEDALAVPVAVEPSGPASDARDIAAITYGANPLKKGLDRVLEAWRRRRSREPSAGHGADTEELLVAGVGARDLQRAGIAVPGAGEGVRLLGALPREEYRALLRRTRVFLCAPRREDYGIAQLEACFGLRASRRASQSASASHYRPPAPVPKPGRNPWPTHWQPYRRGRGGTRPGFPGFETPWVLFVAVSQEQDRRIPDRVPSPAFGLPPRFRG